MFAVKHGKIRENQMSDEIIKVRKSELQKLLDANVEAFSILDGLTTDIDDVNSLVKKAFRSLEDAPAEISDMIINEEEDSDE